MSTKTILAVVLVLVAVGGIFAWARGSKESTVTETQKPFPIEYKPETQTTESAQTGTKPEPITSKGSYEAYGSDKIAKAVSGKVVLFFYAAWCPTCRTLDADIVANLNKIPDGVTILKTDYDSETALKQKYGVTYQHTLVQVDADGKLLAKWAGSPTLASLLLNVR